MEIKFVSAKEAAKFIRSGDRVYLSSNCAQPQTMTHALCERAQRLQNVRVYHLLTAGEAPYGMKDMRPHLLHEAFFVASNVRSGCDSGFVDYIPVHLSEIPRLFLQRIVPVDVAIVGTTMPNENGDVSMGVSVDLTPSAIAKARVIIAEVMPEMPWTHGATIIKADQIKAYVKSEHPLIEHQPTGDNELSRAIASHVAPLIQDGACLQAGIGTIPETILSSLTDRNDLSIHTELMSDGLIHLCRNGNVTNKYKSFKPGISVGTFMLASRASFDYVHENTEIEFHPSEIVNDPAVIGTNDSTIAINGALQIDLTGQIVADSIGKRIYSGFGGQVDFVRGANRSLNGKSIHVIPSTAKGGTVSRIVPTLTQGAGVVTTRADVRYVATEYGCINLLGLSIRERAMCLIELAHPDFRDQLREETERSLQVPCSTSA